MEDQEASEYARAKSEENPILRQKILNRADLLGQQLDLHGANPKKVPFTLLRDHIRAPAPNYEDLTNHYKAKIKNRATAIRAYCVGCMGGSLADVRMCTSFACPLHPFRMGKDPLRGWDIPKVEEPDIPEDDEDIGEFEDADDDQE